MTNHNAHDTNQGCGYWELINAHEVAQADPYDVLVDSIADGSLKLPSEFSLYPFHPGGAQITSTHIEILVTDYNEPGTIDVGVYAMPNNGDDDPIMLEGIPASSLLEHLQNILYGEGWQMPAPVQAEALAACYLASVRTSPYGMHQLANLADGDLDDVLYEVYDAAWGAGLIVDAHSSTYALSDAMLDACRIAARFACDVCRHEATALVTLQGDR